MDVPLVDVSSMWAIVVAVSISVDSTSRCLNSLTDTVAVSVSNIGTLMDVLKWWRQHHRCVCNTYWYIKGCANLFQERLCVSAYSCIYDCASYNSNYTSSGWSPRMVNQKKAWDQWCPWLTKHRRCAANNLFASLVVCLLQPYSWLAYRDRLWELW